MAIRFCKGKNEKSRVEYGVRMQIDFFKSASILFNRNSNVDYLPVVDNDGSLLCYCYNDPQADSILNHVLALSTSEAAINEIKKCEIFQIISLNEISWQWARLLIKSGCRVKLVGNFWRNVMPKNDRITYCEAADESIKNSLFAEGNIGIDLYELGFWKRSFPNWEYQEIEVLYERLKRNNGLYNVGWLSYRDAQAILREHIQSSKPFMAARLGNTEAKITSGYAYGIIPNCWKKWLYKSAGFYSVSEKNKDNDCVKYAKLSLESLRICDFNLCRFESEIPLINQFAPAQSLNIDWYDLYVVDEQNWTTSLIGKRVLIVSSISDTIKRQIKKRACAKGFLMAEKILYYDMPETYFEECRRCSNWFEEFESIKCKLSEINFDIAIIAGGAYGYPLAAFVKMIGKQAIDICSGIYPLFHIKNNTQSIIRRVSSLYSRDWVFPIENPKYNIENIERAAYWE